MTDNTEELKLKLVTYLSFYVEARDAKDSKEMAKWIDKILDLINGAYADGFKKAAHGSFITTQNAKREAVQAFGEKVLKELDDGKRQHSMRVIRSVITSLMEAPKGDKK